MLKINEIFGPTIQGEGKSAGKPVIFLRLALCNLRCVWCDTPYTWNWFGSKHKQLKQFNRSLEVHEMNTSDVVNEITSLAGNIRLLIISGGEPLLQQEKLIPVIQSLKDLGWSIEVETNGTIIPTKKFFELVDQINCSPKLENSDNAREKRGCPFTIKALTLSNMTNFKFVVSSKDDIEEILIIVNYIRDFGNPEIRLMPLSQTKEELLSRESMVKDLCKKHNFIYCTRLSILKSGTKRRV